MEGNLVHLLFHWKSLVSLWRTLMFFLCSCFLCSWELWCRCNAWFPTRLWFFDLLLSGYRTRTSRRLWHLRGFVYRILDGGSVVLGIGRGVWELRWGFESLVLVVVVVRLLKLRWKCLLCCLRVCIDQILEDSRIELGLWKLICRGRRWIWNIRAWNVFGLVLEISLPLYCVVVEWWNSEMAKEEEERKGMWITECWEMWVVIKLINKIKIVEFLRGNALVFFSSSWDFPFTFDFFYCKKSVIDNISSLLK